MVVSKLDGVSHLLKSAEICFCKGFEPLFYNFSRPTMTFNNKIHMNKMPEKPLALTVAEVKQWLIQNDEIRVLDIRPAQSFEAGFITGAITICSEDNLSECLTALQLQIKPIILVTDTATEERIQLMQQQGYQQIIGYLKDGMNAWNTLNEPIDLMIAVEADELAMDIKFDEQLILIDTRSDEEFEAEHLNNAVNIPFTELKDPASMANFEDFQNIYIYGENGYRGITACSLIKKEGIHNLRHLQGGWPEIKAMGAVFELIKPSKKANHDPKEN